MPLTLYTCGVKGAYGGIGHPCGRAASALEEAGYEFDIEVGPGYRLMPWTRGGETRAEVRRLSGQDNVPVLILEDGSVISGSGKIAGWARANPA